MSVTYDEATSRLLGLLQALDGAGLGDQLPEARALLARAVETDSRRGTGAADAERTRAELVAAVADGTTPLADAVAKFATLAPWLTPGGPADALSAGVVTELRARAVRAARDGGLAVHGVLAKRADRAVRRAVDAGRRLIDAEAIARALTPPKVAYGAPHPWLTTPPVLPSLSFEDIQGDGAKMAAWSDAAAGRAEWLEVHRVAGLLHDVAGGSSTYYAGKTDDDVWYFAKHLPDVVHLAVVDALGWRPGLHSSLRPAERPSMLERVTDKMAGWATPAQQQHALRRLTGR